MAPLFRGLGFAMVFYSGFYEQCKSKVNGQKDLKGPKGQDRKTFTVVQNISVR